MADLPEYRKIKDHFETVCKDVFEDIQVGNQSGKEGDKSKNHFDATMEGNL